MITDAGCTALITDNKEGLVPPFRFNVPTLKFPENVDNVGCFANTSDLMTRYVDDAWGIIYSSGTTGIPKGIVRSDFSMLNEMLGWCLELPITRESVAMIGRPVYYTGGFVLTASTLFVGGTVVLPSEWSLDSYRKFCDLYPIDFLFLLPDQVLELVSRKAVTSESWPHPRRILTMGAPINPDLKSSVCEVIGCQYIESWGNSEGLGTVTEANDVIIRPRSIGRPFLTDDLFIIDEFGQEVPTGSVGRIAGRADSTLTEYRNRDDLNQNLFQNGAVISEDLGFVDSDGYFYVCGRVTQRIMRNGIPVFGTDIESVIRDLSLVRDVAIVGIPDSHEGEVPVAALVLEGRAVVSSDEIIETLNAALSPAHRISGVLIYNTLPRNAAGKIDYPSIKGKYLDRVDGKSSDGEAV
jgi:acyl-CoA synthetase (AMP-forming)/AMP-acid ligase II